MITDNLSCPICGSSSVTYLETLTTWICKNCSGVFDTNNVPLDVEKIQQIEALEQSQDETNSEEWSNQIAPKDNSEANLIRYLEIVEDIINELSLQSDIEVRTAEITTEAWKSNFLHGRSAEGVIGASLYMSTRECGFAVPPGRIADALQIEKPTLKRTYKQLKSELNITLGPADPTEFVHYICKCHQLPSDYKEDALTLLARSDIPGGNPIGVAAGAIYLIGTHKEGGPTQRDLAQTTYLTKETIYRKSSELSVEGLVLT